MLLLIPLAFEPRIMHESADTQLSARGLRIAVVTSRYHADITRALREGARRAFRAADGAADALLEIPAPGAFELTGICSALAHSDRCDGIVALGCIIRGETEHDRHLAAALAHGLTGITVATGVPIAFGVLTCQTLHQARERAGGEHGNKGEESMVATIEAIHAIRSVRDLVR